MREDPYAVLGLPKDADKLDVKRAFREKALRLHPDLNTAADAAEKYGRVRRAAEAILNGTDYHTELATGSSRKNSWRVKADRISRSSRFPMYFSAACLLGGCVIFAGALHAHNTVFGGYSYHLVEETERRRQNPSPGQQRILSLLTEKRDFESTERPER